MFKQLLIEGKRIDNYKINEEGVVMNRKGKEIKRTDNLYRLYIDGKHRAFNVDKLVNWTFENKDSYVDDTVESYLDFEKIVINMGGQVRENTEIINNFLTIIDHNLHDVDPNSSSLTSEQRLRVIEECKDNPWYFFRRILEMPMDVILYSTVKSIYAGVDSYLQAPHNYDFESIRNAIITYHTYFGSKDVCIADKHRYTNIDAFSSLSEGHWIKEIKPNNSLFSINLIPVAIDEKLNDFLVISIDTRFSELAFNGLTHTRRLDSKNIIASIVPDIGRNSSFYYSLYVEFVNANIFGSVNLLKSEACRFENSCGVYMKIAKEAISPNKNDYRAEHNGYSPFYSSTFAKVNEDDITKALIESYDINSTNHVLNRLNKDGKKFIEFACRVVDSVLNLPDIHLMIEESIVSLFSVVRRKFIENILEFVDHTDKEDLIYIIFGTRDYSELNDSIQEFESFDRHIYCTIFNNNAYNANFYGTPVPVTFTIEALIKKIYI